MILPIAIKMAILAIWLWLVWTLVVRNLPYLLTRPAVVAWLIRRARRTPYSPIIVDDLLYMERFWLFNPYPYPDGGQSGADRPRWQFPISIRLHHIRLPDPDRHLHDHPWNARTVILSGGYTEVRPLDPVAHADSKALFDRIGLPAPTGTLFDRTVGDTCRLRFGEYHRIVSVKPDTWTMFITGRYRGTWGFLVDGVKVQWRTYLGIAPKP